MSEPLAVLIYRRYLDGKTVEQLSADFGISRERIEQRLRAAAAYLARRPSLAA
jgi:DNA-directed RNA polymerase sigma subunit (sigma70/sigma32)